MFFPDEMVLSRKPHLEELCEQLLSAGEVAIVVLAEHLISTRRTLQMLLGYFCIFLLHFIWDTVVYARFDKLCSKCSCRVVTLYLL